METDGLGGARGCLAATTAMLGVAMVAFAIYARLQWQSLDGGAGTTWMALTLISGACGLVLLVYCYLICLRSTEQNP